MRIIRSRLQNMRLFLPLALISAFFLLLICCNDSNIEEVDLDNRRRIRKVENEKALLKENSLLRIAVGSMITPREGFGYYEKLANYIGGKMGKNVKLVDRKTYRETNRLLKQGYIDMAFICGRPYVDGHDEFGLELLVAPQIDSKVEYHSFLIVNQNSRIETLDDLRGKVFAFADPDSNSGKLVPTFMLAQIGETPESFFSRYVYTYAHDKSIKAVSNGIVDGAAVDSLIWNYYNTTRPDLTSQTRVILQSPPYGIPPVVVSPEMDNETKDILKRIFVNIHRDEKGKEILEGMMIDKFVPLQDSHYDSIRHMIAFLEQTTTETGGER
jgi:phosphonate transport system substrate-binding protein